MFPGLSDDEQGSVLFHTTRLIAITLRAPEGSTDSLSLFEFGTYLTHLVVPNASEFMSVLLTFGFSMGGRGHVDYSLVVHCLFFGGWFLGPCIFLVGAYLSL